MNWSNVLRMGLGLWLRLPQLANLQAAVLDFRYIAIERPHRRAVKHFAVEREKRTVAGTHELVAGGFPVVGAAQMRALRAEGHDLVIRLFDHPRGFLFRNEFPPIEAAFLEIHLDGRSGSQLADVAGIDPARLLARARGHKKIQGGWNREGES